jgi:hypothetical protein
VNDTTAGPDHKALFAIASAQAGCFTTAQEATAGFSSSLLSHHVTSGGFLRLARGVYRLRDYPSQPGDEVVAAWLRQAPNAVVSHESALEVLDLADVIADRVDSTDTISRRGMRVTAPARTIVDVAAVGGAPDQVVKAVHTALARGLTTPSLLRDAARSRGRRVRRLVEAALTGQAG